MGSLENRKAVPELFGTMVFNDDVTEEQIRSAGIDLKSFKKDGKIIVITMKGDAKEATERLNALSPALIEEMPLSLEEVFLDEMEGTDYDFTQIFSK